MIHGAGVEQSEVEAGVQRGEQVAATGNPPLSKYSVEHGSLPFKKTPEENMSADNAALSWLLGDSLDWTGCAAISD